MSKCKDCRYGFYSGIEGITGCEYIIAKHEPRGCPPGEKCTRFESNSEFQKRRKDVYKPMAKLTEETKREIVQLAMTGAMTQKAIAEKFGIGKSTVWYLVDQFKKSGETALSGETEVETEKEPETAATVTGSEQEICEDIPADIIPENPEDVKPSNNYSPFAAKAIWNEINALREEAAALEERETQIEEIISDNKDWLRSTDEQLMYVEAEIDSLLADYEAMTGGRMG